MSNVLVGGILLTACRASELATPEHADCAVLNARACTDETSSLLDRGRRGKVVCRAAVGCEPVVSDLDFKGRPGHALYGEFVSRCEEEAGCR